MRSQLQSDVMEDINLDSNSESSHVKGALKTRSAALITDASHITKSGIFTTKEAYLAHKEEIKKRSLISNNLEWCIPAVFTFILLLVSTIAYFTIRGLFSFTKLSSAEVFFNTLLLIAEILLALVTIPVCYSRVFKWKSFEMISGLKGEIQSITILVCGYNVQHAALSRCVDALMLAGSDFGKPFQIVLYDYVDEFVMELASRYKNDSIVGIRQRKTKETVKVTKPELINFVLDKVFPELTSLEGEAVCFLEGNQIVDRDFFVDAMKYFDMDPHLSLLQYATHQSITPSSAGDIFSLRRPIENHFLARLTSAAKNYMAFETNFIFKAGFVLTNLTGVVETCEGAWGTILTRKFHKMQERCFFVNYPKSKMFHKEKSIKDSYKRLSQEAFARFEIGIHDRSGLLFEHILFTQAMLYRLEWFRLLIISTVEPILIIFPFIAVIFGICPIRCDNTGYVYLMLMFLVYYGLTLFMSMGHMDFFGIWNQVVSDKFLWWLRMRAFYRSAFTRKPLDSFSQFTEKTFQGVPPLIVPTPYSISQDLLVHIVIFLVNFISVFIGAFLVLNAGQIQTKTLTENIPMLLMIFLGVYNSVVHFTPLFGGMVKSSTGRGIYVRVMSIFIIAGISAACLGIGFYALQNPPIDYKEVMNLALDFFQIQKSGRVVGDFGVSWRGVSNMQDSAMMASGRQVDLRGGFYHGAGSVKFTLPIAYSVSMLALAFKLYPAQIAAAGKEKYFDVMQWGGDYLWSCVLEPDVTSATPQIVVQVGDLEGDLSEWTRPEQSKNARTVFIAGSEFPAAEVTAMSAAALAGAAFTMQYWDQGYVKPYMQKAFSMYQTSWNLTSYTNTNKFEQLQFVYPSNGYFDELMYAAAWLASINSGNYQYTQDFLDAKKLIPINARMNPTSVTNMYMLAQTMLAITPGYESERNITKKYIDLWIDARPPLSKTPDGLPVARNGRRNMPSALEVGFMAAAIGSTEVIQKEKTRYLCWAFQQLDYALGNNDLGMSYMIGYGDKYPLYVRHKAASCPPSIRAPCGKQYLNSQAANPSIARGGVVNGPNVQGKFRDQRSNAVQNQPFIENTVAAFGIAAMANKENVDKLCLRSESFIQYL